MKRQTKIIITILLLIIVSIGGYCGYQKYNLSKKLQTSDKAMKNIGVAKLNNTDKSIVTEILKKDKDLEYAYITHSGNTVMLTLKFKKGIQDKDKNSKAIKYMKQIKTYYKGKNINVSTVG